MDRKSKGLVALVVLSTIANVLASAALIESSERIDTLRGSLHHEQEMRWELHKQTDLLKQHIDVSQKRLDVAHQRIKQLESEKVKLTSRGGRIDRGSGWRTAKARITAYSPFDDQNGLNSQGDGSVTSTGKRPGYGKFAVDPGEIPYGSEVIITYADGTTESGVAVDTGGAIRAYDGIAVDVFRQTFEDATRFGKRIAVVRWKPPAKEEK